MNLLKAVLLAPLLLYCLVVSSQDSVAFIPHGKGSGVIFTNFHYGISESSSDEAAFEIVRAYLGYEHFLSPEFSARLTLDIGSPDDVSPFSRLRRYAYFKFAYGQYQKDNLTLQFGLIGTLHYKLQETLWERRYLRKAFADEYRLGPSADLGALAVYRFSEMLEADLTVMNGEGFTRLQMDDKFKYAAGITLRAPVPLINRFYVDYMKNQVSQMTYTWVTSYTWRKNLNLVFEYNYQQNFNLQKNRDLYGYSIYGKYNIHPAYQLFARFDMLKSNIPEDSQIPWHLAEDGSALITGIQFIPVKGIKMALNYQDWVPWAANLATRSFIFLDMEIRL
ncbi:MAG: porin [Bacteroidota bacterium]